MINKNQRISKKEICAPPDGHNNLFYTTYDMGVSAALVSAGFELVSMDKEDPRKVLFIFTRETDIEDVVDSYWADKLEVKSRSFFDNVKMLKNRIHSK